MMHVKRKLKEWEKKLNKLLESLLKEMKKNSVLKVNKLYNSDAIIQSRASVEQEKDIIDQNMNLKQIIRLWETNTDKLKSFVYLVSALIELDKNYTQDLADSLVFFNEKTENVRNSLEDFTSTLRTLEEGKVSNIVSKNRKTVDGRDEFMNNIYFIAQAYLKNYNCVIKSLKADQYLSKKNAIIEILKAFKNISNTLKSSLKCSQPDMNKKIIESEGLQRISKDICCWILKNNLEENTNFSYLKTDIFNRIELWSNKISDFDEQIDIVRDEISKIMNESTVKSLYGIEVK